MYIKLGIFMSLITEHCLCKSVSKINKDLNFVQPVEICSMRLYRSAVYFSRKFFPVFCTSLKNF